MSSKRKLEHEQITQSQKMRNNNKNNEPITTSSSLSSSSSSSLSSSYPIQFFVSMISGSPFRTLVLHADPSDTVEFLHRRIQSLTGIPSEHQRLIYNGKQLQWDKTIAQSNLQNDSSLHLVSRLRSTHHPHSHSLLDSLLSLVISLVRDTNNKTDHSSRKLVCSRLTEFLSITPKPGGLHSPSVTATSHLSLFLSSSAPAALVMLYLSPRPGNRQTADESIRQFLASCRRDLPKSTHPFSAPVVLQFCNLLPSQDPLYVVARTTLGSMMDSFVLRRTGNEDGVGVRFHDVFRFVKETAARLGREVEGGSVSVGDAAKDFAAFLGPVMDVVREAVGVVDARFYVPCIGNEVNYLYGALNVLLMKMEVCLRRVEESLVSKVEGARLGWCHYLPILKQLENMSKGFQGAEEVFWEKMKGRKVALTHLIVTYAKRDGDHAWLLAHKEVLEFESRRHLVLMMLPELREDYEELHEMLIDRAHMLSESFEYIGRVEPEALKSGLFMEFKHEEATGPGVLREWFFLVCQKIFNPENALFVACPNDRRRFFPNHVSKVHPSGIGLEYFGFAGRVIALALMHKLQVGIVFDRVFFLQLAGKKVSLEDIRDADPCMYSSCKKILELDADVVDSDALGLTFVREVEELGARTMVELCPGGKSRTINSHNRQEYVDCLIEHRFVESIKEQVQRFAKGFADMLCIPGLYKLFFQSLELQDLDWMLHGSETAISVEDWMAHTDYNGFKETDPQITWFWKIVGEMSSEQKKVLLFFWTSLKCLPVEGFRGLASRLYIYKSTESLDRLPSSHTCFYRICFPPYPSMAVMQDRLNIITQEHVSCSFGTW